jgi:hypothetical protein
MKLKEEHLNLCFLGWMAARRGQGMVLGHRHYPAAHELAQTGWLRRKMVGKDLAWFWPDEGEQAFTAANTVAKYADNTQ